MCIIVSCVYPLLSGTEENSLWVFCSPKLTDYYVFFVINLLNLEHILLWSFIEMKYVGQSEHVKFYTSY